MLGRRERVVKGKGQTVRNVGRDLWCRQSRDSHVARNNTPLSMIYRGSFWNFPVSALGVVVARCRCRTWANIVRGCRISVLHANQTMSTGKQSKLRDEQQVQARFYLDSPSYMTRLNACFHFMAGQPIQNIAWTTNSRTYLFRHYWNPPLSQETLLFLYLANHQTVGVVCDGCIVSRGNTSNNQC